MDHRPITVLLVEDNPGDARLLREMFRDVISPQFEVTHVERLSEALERLAQRRFDAVLLDLSLTDSSRLETLIRIHGHAAEVPIVVLTGLDDDTLAVWTLEEGAQDYLVKGQVDGDSLVRCIRYAIQRHKAIRLRAAYSLPASRTRPRQAVSSSPGYQQG